MGQLPYAAVIGSVNMDICGKPRAAFVPRDSNPGSATHTIGGVGAEGTTTIAEAEAAGIRGKETTPFCLRRSRT